LMEILLTGPCVEDDGPSSYLHGFFSSHNSILCSFYDNDVLAKGCSNRWMIKGVYMSVRRMTLKFVKCCLSTFDFHGCIRFLHILFLFFKIVKLVSESFWILRRKKNLYASGIQDLEPDSFLTCTSVCGKNFSLVNFFYIIRGRTFIIGRSIIFDKTSLLVSKFWTMWPWLWC
jgi:hypothetical protein